MADESTPQPLDYHGIVQKKIKPPDDPESRRWRYRRILFRIGLFAGILPVTCYFGGNIFMFGKLTRLSPADFVPTVQRTGIPIVRAIKEYQRDTGHFPDQIKDLQPKYLGANPGFGADIENGQFSEWTKLNHFITYDFTPGAEGWKVSGPFANGPIPLPPVTIPPAAQPVPPTK